MVRTRSEILYFYGSNCPVCKTMAPFIDEAGEKFEGRVVLRKVNASQNQKLAQQYRVMAVPTTVALSDGAEVTRVVGARTPGGLRRLFESAETGEVLESGISTVDRGIRIGVAVGFAGFALWTGVWVLWILAAVALVFAFWDKIRR
ncbi:MAG: thioredoxin family protein [Actinomycetota bacterium]|nr:thioredoxin family protein [Actinomycetota bacterium]